MGRRTGKERFSAQAARLAEDPAAFLTAAIQAYVAASVNNRMPAFPGEVLWDAPLVGFADGDDPLFHDYKRIIGDFHVTPREVLEMRIRASVFGPPRPAAVGVIAFVLPSKPATRRSQRPETAVFSPRWNATRNGNAPRISVSGAATSLAFAFRRG